MPDQGTVEAVTKAYEESIASAPPEAAEPAGDAGREVDAAAAADKEHAQAGRVRDDKGRFSAKGEREPAAPGKAAAEAPSVADAVDQGAADASPAAPAAPALPKLNAPQDWRAAARAKWDSLPREAQEEALRLHTETKKTLQRAADLERTAQEWQGVVAGTEHIFRPGGEPVHQAVARVVRSYAELHTASPARRGQILGQLARQFLGADEASLAHLAAGIHGGDEQPGAQPQGMSPEQVRQLARQEWEAAQHAATRDAGIQAWKDFEPTADLLSEEGVRRDLADLAGKWERENPGQVPTKEVFQKLYDRACQINEGASKIVNQRKEAAAVKAKAASTPQAAAAASGVKNEPAGPTGQGKAKNTHEELEKQWDRLERRRL